MLPLFEHLQSKCYFIRALPLTETTNSYRYKNGAAVKFDAVLVSKIRGSALSAEPLDHFLVLPSSFRITGSGLVASCRRTHAPSYFGTMAEIQVQLPSPNELRVDLCNPWLLNSAGNWQPDLHVIVALPRRTRAQLLLAPMLRAPVRSGPCVLIMNRYGVPCRQP